ncbi:MAG: DUF924 domain-containing protein [Halobacteriovoraceae bacterium]|jgi:uncharacterized protein (DUF924 family)|nr:DUF924 domain-containing protein [Halobacteriovoraceae bacterium]
MKEKVLNFWFTELEAKDWYMKSDPLDKKISDLFLETYSQATRGELFHWRNSIEGRLAEIIVLDQFSRNIFRNNAKSFQYDCIALALSQEASLRADAKELPVEKKAFLYMPFMHSESLHIHEQAVKLFSEPGLENNLAFEIKHKNIIERFARYPHRNALLGRVSTAEEIEFLKEPGSSF